MKNEVIVRGDTAIIFLPHKGITRTVLVDVEDLPKVSKIPGSWYAMDVGGKRGEKIYAGTTIGGVTIYMHKLILRSEPGLVIDHSNHDSLDNRKLNLRNVTLAQNGQNRKGAQRNNRNSGLRNVYRTQSGKWFVQLNKDGKTYRYGNFETIEIANRVAEQAREWYYEKGFGGLLAFSKDGSMNRPVIS